jgi:hypothetical protein
MQKITPTNENEASDHAKEWQQWASDQDLSYGELAEWAAHFEAIALQFDLVAEFQENGII